MRTERENNMIAFLLLLSVSIGTSLLVQRQTKQRFSVIFLAIILLLFCLAERRMQHIEEKISVQENTFAIDD